MSELNPLGERLTAQMRKNGVILAEVTNIKDPQKLNRLKCKPVSLDKDVAETDWCFCAAPMAGKDYGALFFPNVGDKVVLGFLNGNVNNPIVLGRYWDAKNPAAYRIEGGVNEISSIKTKGGTEIKFDDKKGKEKLTITMPSKAALVLDDEKKTVSLLGDDGDNLFTLNWQKGEITLAAKQRLTLSAGKTSLVLDSSGAIEGKGTGKVSFEGTDVELKGKSSFVAEGATATVKGSSTLTAQSSGATNIKGSVVKIN